MKTFPAKNIKNGKKSDNKTIKSSGFYIGIDSGGTKCEIIISSPGKRILTKKPFKAYHYSVCGAKIVAEKISSCINSLLKKKKLRLNDCKGICIGLAGAREEKDRIKLQREFSKQLGFKKISIETDTMTGIYGAFEGNDGIILISGTGSVLYGISEGRLSRIGGWGRILGDAGSGFWIGQQGFLEATKEYDVVRYKKNYSMLTKELEKHHKIHKFNIMENLFHKNFDVQKIAPLVIKCAEKKDRKCLRIIDEAVEGLASHISAFLKTTKRRAKIDLAFIGSIIENDNIVSKKLKAKIKKEFKLINVKPKQHSSAYGAVLLAEKNFP